MYLHLGEDVVVSTNNIIAMLDMEGTTMSKTSKEFLKVAEEEGFVKNVSDALPKSYVICEIGDRSVVYITNISTATLYKRARR